MKTFLLILPVVLLLAGCSSGGEGKLLVATAANVQFVMEELSEAFTEETGVPVEIIYGSSGKLSAQIMEGAPFDVLVSADMIYPQELHKAGKAIAPPKIYAYGTLVLWTLEENFSPELNMLAEPAVKNIAIANPKNAPYGVAAVEALKFYGLYPLVKDRLVYGESVSQTSQFIMTRNASVGITAKSVVVSPKLKNRGKWKDIPEESYEPIRQGVVIIKNERDNMKDAEKFYNFLFSEKARNILLNYGYNSFLPDE